MIPFSKPTIGQEEIDAVTEVLKSGWLTVGDKVREFEKNIQEYTKSPTSVLCKNSIVCPLSHFFGRLV